MKRLFTRKMNPAVKLFEGEKWLVLAGLLGLLLAGACGGWVLLYGGPTGQEGDVSKAFSFNAALGLFLISTAAIVPLSGMGTRGRAIFRRGYFALALYSYFAETVQNFRGVNPRFPHSGAAFDIAVASIFILVALLLGLFYLVLALSYFRRKAYLLRPEMVVSIRYSMIAVMISFAAGLWISALQGRHVGIDGDIIWLHGFGFHALQVLPLVAWLAEPRATLPSARSKPVHVAGIAFLLGLAAVGWQTLLGRSIFEWSALPLAAGLCFLIALAPAALLLRPESDQRAASL